MRVGGDPFEYRPLDFYWPLLAVPAAEGILHLGAGAASLLRLITPRLRLPRARTCARVLFIPVIFYASAMQAALLFEADRTAGSNVTLNRQNTGWLFRVAGMGARNDLAGGLRQQITRHGVGYRFASHREFARGRIKSWQPYDGVAGRLIPHDAVRP